MERTNQNAAFRVKEELRKEKDQSECSGGPDLCPNGADPKDAVETKTDDRAR